MVHIRTAAIAVAMILVSMGAHAQTAPPLVCSTTAQQSLALPGQTEKAADLVITCTGGQAPAPGTRLPQVNISVTVSAALAGSGDILLSIDDPQPNAESLCAPAAGTVCSPLFAGGEPGTAAESSATGTMRNVFRGVRQNANTVVWLQVPLSAPGTQGTTRVFRTRNLKVASAGQSFAFVSIQNAPSNLQLDSSTVSIARNERRPAGIQLVGGRRIWPETTISNCLTRSARSSGKRKS